MQRVVSGSAKGARILSVAAHAVPKVGLLTALLCSTQIAPIALPAAAQTADVVADDGETVILGEIVVTTRRTEEVLEDVPGSVVVITDEELERSNAIEGIDVLERLPNVNFTEASDPSDVEISIRGISDLVGANAASGPTNGVFVDGVLLNPTGTFIGINPNLLDLERVEVAFGPQGTAFGRGTIGGAINYVTKKPTEELEFTLSGGVGSFPDGDLRAVANAPILENGLLSARIVAFGRYSDGFLDLTTIGDDSASQDYGGRISLRSQPTDRLTFDISASFDRSEFDAPSASLVSDAEDGDPQSPINFVEQDRLDRLLITGDIAYEFDFGTLTSKSSFLNTDFDSLADSDFTELDIITTDLDAEDRSVSQEFRFESAEFDLPSQFGTIAVNGGVSFSFNRGDNAFIVDTGSDFFAGATALAQGLLPPTVLPPTASFVDDGGFGGLDSRQDVDTIGIYGDVRWRPVPPLELAVGARFSRDRVKVSSVSTGAGLISTGIGLLEIPGLGTIPFDTTALLDPVFPPEPFAEEEETFSAVTPNASILYEWSDTFTTYASFSTGFRAGGFSASSTEGLVPFDEEKVRSFEAGFRARFLENRLQLRANGFFLDYDDVQVTSTTDQIGILIVDNAAAARSVGSEIGITVVPVTGLRAD
ncbi:MAG: TonB-dependent receptor, partial [Pseudomonadota bacterium]